MILPRRKSLMTKAAVVLLILILPFNILGIITSVISYRNSIANTRAVIEYTLDSYKLLLNNKIKNCNSALFSLINNNEILLDMRSARDDSAYQIRRHRLFVNLDEQRRTYDTADVFFIYAEDRDDYMQVPAFDRNTAGTRPHFSYIENYDYSHAQWFISEDHSQLLRVLYAKSMNVYLGTVILLPEFLAAHKGMKGFDSLELFFGDEEVGKKAGLLTFNTKIDDGVYLSAEVSTREINASINFLQYALILFFVIYLALIPILYQLMKRYMGIPLVHLNDAHAQLTAGNEDYRITEKANSQEFETAYESFNHMASSLQQLQKEVLEKELANKQLQVDYLQLQIRPHFLLNAFNVLYTLIQRGQREPSQEMVLFLSDYFRYLFRSGNEMQLFAKERRLIEDYMNITKIYYPESFEVSYQLDPLLDLMRVPPLLLHSFMENIIAHALLPDRLVHIVFSGEYDDGMVTFYISDDGKGIDRESMEAINHIAERPATDGKNVGIKNSILRLKYYYGDEASVICESEPLVGTTFTITIPYDLDDVQETEAEPSGGASGTSLPSAALRSADLPGAGLPGAELPGAGHAGEDLPGADFPGVGHIGADLPGDDLSGAGIPEADPPDAVLSDAGLPGASLPGTGIPDVDLSGTGIPDVGLPGTGHAGTGLSDLELHGKEGSHESSDRQ